MNRAMLLVGLIAFCPGVQAEEAADRDNVVILLDGSGSMRENMGAQTKIVAAKQAIVGVLATVPATTQVGLLVFSDGTGADGWVYPLGPRNDSALLAALQPIRPGGGTPLGQYIKIAADRLLQQREAQLGYGTFRLLVVTDGEAGDAELVQRYAPEVVARGVILDVIGVDMEQDHQLASLAHSYRKADDADSLRTALQDVLGEVSGAGGDTAGEEAFTLLAGLADGVAEAVLTAFAPGNNAPIGEGPAVARARHPQGSAPPMATAPPPPTAQRGRSSRNPMTTFIWLVVAVVVGSKVLKAMRKG